MISPVAFRDDVLPADLLDELAAAGIESAITTAQSLKGPLGARWTVDTADGSHLWIDALGSTPVRSTLLEGPLPVDGRVIPSIGTALPSGVVHVLPWRAQMLHDLAATEDGTGRILTVSHAVGRYFRKLSPTPVPPGSTAPAVLTRLSRPTVPNCLASQPHWVALTRSARHSTEVAVRIHGNPAGGNVLVATDSVSGPLACLIGWDGPRIGPASFDVGHMMGDLLEQSALAVPGSVAAKTLRDAAWAVRAGYEEEGAHPARFWYAAARAAALKIVDHEYRLRFAFGPAVGEASGALDRLAIRMLDPSDKWGRSFAPDFRPGNLPQDQS